MPLSLQLNPTPLKPKSGLADGTFQDISKTPFHRQLNEFQNSTGLSDRDGLLQKVIKLSALRLEVEKLLVPQPIRLRRTKTEALVTYDGYPSGHTRCPRAGSKESS